MQEQMGSWEAYQRLVLAELKRFDEDIQDIKSKQQEILSEIAVLKVKAGVWGAIGGLLTAIASGILFIIGGKH